MVKRLIGWLERNRSHSTFFLIAVLFHLILLLAIASWVVFSPLPPAHDTTFDRIFVTVHPEPPATPHDSTLPNPNVTGDTTSVASIGPSLIKNPFGQSGFKDPGFSGKDIQVLDLHPPSGPHHPHAPIDLSKLPAARYVDQASLRDGRLKAKFPIYLAAYADGDWHCNNYLDADGKIVAGSLPNLAEWINQKSHGDIVGEVNPTPLQIGGPELLDKMPPFIFFTGHKDFILTDREIDNLRSYLGNGGVIWGDNAMAGAGSRFDVAFRREMKRVIPDRDVTFEPLEVDDPVMKARFSLDKLPSGMNHVAEQVEVLKLQGKMAIIYTPNDYSDLMTLHFKPGTEQPDLERTSDAKPLFTPDPFRLNARVYFRNYSAATTLEVDKLGMNIVTHLLTQYDQEMLLMP